MAGRTSARTSASRNHASSPPKPSNDRVSQTPIAQRTRSGRNRSVDLGESDRGTPQKPLAKRATRQASFESDASATSRGRRTRQTTRAAPSQDLSMVAEDVEGKDKEEGNDEDGEGEGKYSGKEGSDEENENEDEDAIEELLLRDEPRSPGAQSQMSGTTAFSAATSHAVQDVTELDALAAENLPHLFAASRAIVKVLVPEAVSTEGVITTVRDLHIAGSRRARRLKDSEDKFQIPRQYYGSKDNYIKVPFIVRSLMGSKDPPEEDSRPDAILYAANLAVLLKDFYVVEKESRKARLLLMDLDSTFQFPEPFLASFDDRARFGVSSLQGVSFEIMLEIRTQFTVASLHHEGDKDEFSPQSILIDAFYDHPPEGDWEPSNIHRVIEYAQPRGWNSEVALSPNQLSKISERVIAINSSFRLNEHARQGRDQVDFDQLEEDFPWLGFLGKLVQWSSLRFEEILEAVGLQGGIENIMRNLVELIKRNDSQANVAYDQTPIVGPAPQLGPAANITEDSRDQSLYSKGNLQFLRRLKNPSSSLPRIPASYPQVTKSKLSNETDKVYKLNSEFYAQNLEDIDDELYQGDYNRPTSQYVASQDEYYRERNKENRPLMNQIADDIGGGKSHQAQEKQSAKRTQSIMSNGRLNIERLTLIGNDDEAGSSIFKNTRAVSEENEDPSEDNGFEEDRRPHDSSRRRALPPPREERAVFKKRRSNDDERETIARNPNSRANGAQQGPRPIIEEDAQEEDNEPPPTFREINQVARLEGLKSRLGKEKPQQRKRWTLNDERYFVEAVEEHGCKWSVLAKLPGWDTRRNQVAIKDKGRNMKVAFLKAKIRLPPGFENIRLSAKEIRQVRNVIPDYEQ